MSSQNPHPKTGIFAAFENMRAQDGDISALLFVDSIEEIVCHKGADIDQALTQIDARRRDGAYLCGHIAYEAGCFLANGPAIDSSAAADASIPLLHFFAFREIKRMTAEEFAHFLSEAGPLDPYPAIQNLKLSLSKSEYFEKLHRIYEYLCAGDSYQVNFTMKYRFEFQGAAVSLYRRLRQRQKVEFASVLHFPEYDVLSLSPELFVRKQGNNLECRPMKGTAKRGLGIADDESIVAEMKADAKTLAENVMIVDMIRNDLARICELGSVTAQRLFEVQTFESLHQMISTVLGRAARDISIKSVMEALFPCASVTGAPKIRTMQIIRELETERRGVYAGAIGYVTPENDFCFNVPIRTCVAQRNGSAEMGVGSGVVFDSNPDEEYRECELKGLFLTGVNADFQLIETFKYCRATGGFEDLEGHLSRLSGSAATLNFLYQREAIIDELNRQTPTCDDIFKVRVLLFLDGRVSVDFSKLDPVVASAPLKIAVSDLRTDRKSFLLRHKTTARAIYEAEYRKHAAYGAYDVLFMNAEGLVTEASRHNLFLERQGRLFTPPVEEGVLPGVKRRQILQRHSGQCFERPLTPADILGADRLFLTNSLRGMVEVSLSEPALKLLQHAARSPPGGQAGE